MGLFFRTPTKEEIEKDITRKETQLYDLRKQLAQHKKNFDNWIACHESYPTPEAHAISQCEYRISGLEDDINNLKKRLLSM